MPSPEVENTAQQLRLAVGQLVRRLRADTAGPTTLPLPQAATIGWLDRGGPMTTAELATAQAVRHQSASRVVDQLEALHLVVLKAHSTDGRKRVVHLTAAGRRAIVRQREQRAGWLAEVMAASLTPAEQRTLGKAAELMLRLVEAPPTARSPRPER